MIPMILSEKSPAPVSHILYKTGLKPSYLFSIFGTIFFIWTE